MNYILFLLILCCIYYSAYNYYPERFEEKYHYYFGGFLICNIILLYLFYYEEQFIYQIFKNIYNTSKQPIYSFNAQQSNSELFHATNPNYNIKYNLATQQMNRCFNCQNNILQNDMNYHKIQYIKPIQYGGMNDTSNLKLICPTCYAFDIV